jgi:hypothetical protein
MQQQTRKMQAPQKPKDRRRSLLSAGGTPIRMIAMYVANSDARKEFKKETAEYEKKKAAYDAAMKQLKYTQTKQNK